MHSLIIVQQDAIHWYTPNLLPQSPKAGAGRGGGGAGRTVMQISVGSADRIVMQMLVRSPSVEGEMLSVFSFLFFAVGSVSCRFLGVFLFLGSLFGINHRERTFWFLLVSVGLVFLVGFCLGFCFMIWRFAPEIVWKNSLNVRSSVFGFVLSSLGFSSTSWVCFLFF